MNIFGMKWFPIWQKGQTCNFLDSTQYAGFAKVKECIVKVAQVIRDHLPHSPAKMGLLKDLNKVEIVETIASTIRPLPLQNAMNPKPYYKRFKSK